MSKPEDLKVFITKSSPTCEECSENLGKGAWITLSEEKGAQCLSCADLDHLVFLPSGNTALTRRSKKHSKLSAVVLKWSRARKRYERQGLLVEETGLVQAESECVADETQRKMARVRASERRAELDMKYVKSFADAIRLHFPSCPKKSADSIARHACRKHSGRVGRSAFAKALDEEAIRLAVIAHIRHEKTEYDELLMKGADRRAARHVVQQAVETTLDNWRKSNS